VSGNTKGLEKRTESGSSHLDFDVLMSIYAGENARYFDECMESLRAQSLQPSNLVLVVDGPLGAALQDAVRSWSRRWGASMKTVALARNVGLASALNAGLGECSSTWVARMDTDDVCMPERFRTQVDFLSQNPGVDVLGSWAEQFDDASGLSTGVRSCPGTDEEIRRWMPFRNPMNHMTVIFRKEKVLGVGGYTPLRYGEDYLLWMKLASGGCRMANVQKSLVRARVGASTIERRRGLRYVALEFSLQRHLLRRGLTTPLKALPVLALRVSSRLLPARILSAVYRRLRDKQMEA
jgi:glycosyltransferase involved in cell wall biosynthesis